VVLYYAGYWFRLVWGCCKSNENGNKIANNSTTNTNVLIKHKYDKLKILTAYFAD